jgi:integrase
MSSRTRTGGDGGTHTTGTLRYRYADRTQLEVVSALATVQSHAGRCHGFRLFDLKRRERRVSQSCRVAGEILPSYRNHWEVEMAHNRGTRHKPRWAGHVSYKGRKKWVGTHSSMRAYKMAEECCLAELRVLVDEGSGTRAPTVLEFAGAAIREGGRITMTWPHGQRAVKATGRRSSTERRMQEALRPFIHEFADRPLDSFGRDEAVTWALARGANVQQSVRQFFNHALDRELIERNPFARIGASRRKRRIDRPGFEIITDYQYACLLRCARASRADSYGLIIEGAILAVGEAAMRPGELFALHRRDLDFQRNQIHVRRQLDLDTGEITWPKDDDKRSVVMSATLRTHLLGTPRISEIVFPAPRGGYMRRSTWSAHWHAVRASAGMPAQDFYELKHRAIQWMIDPTADGGLGLDPATVAVMVGHDDGGYLIATVYTKLSENRALARAQRAMDTYERRHAAGAPQLP